MGTDTGLSGSRRDDGLKGRDPGAAARRSYEAALAHLERGRLGEAEAACRRALRALEWALGRDHPELAIILDPLVQIRLDRGDLAGAEELGRRAVALARAEVDGVDSRHILVQALDRLAGVCRVQGRYDQAETLYREALCIAGSVSGPDGREVAALLNDLAVLHKFQGRFTEAGRLYRRALAIKERALGREHPDVALTLHNLGVLRGARGDAEGAAARSRRALAIATATLGEAHPLVAACRDHLAGLLHGPSGRVAAPLSG
jgi:tetratricopeptide (TPR) repeat protein